MLTKKGKRFMKILKIENNKATFTIGEKVDVAISEIQKEEILKILEYIYFNDEFEMDENDDSHPIANDAEKIIYKSLYDKLIEFSQKKEALKKDIEKEFISVKQKYDLK